MMRPPSDRLLEGRRVLIVEDRFFIASEMADDISRLGGRVIGPCSSVAAAAALLDREAIDVGLLDVNLGGEMVFPIARALADRGVPFIFLTGYDEESLPAAWRDRPLLEKPVTPSILGEALAGVA